MFWNRKKKEIHEQTAADNTPDRLIPAKESEGSEKKLSLLFLKRLIPISGLPDEELQQLKAIISHFEPGDIIFNRGEMSDSLSYIIKGKCYVEASNGSGYEVDASTFKACYPLSGSSTYECTAIARSDVSIVQFSRSVIIQGNFSSRNPLLNNEDIPEKLRDNVFLNSFCNHFKQGDLIIPSLPDVALKLRTAVQKEIGVQEAVKIINFDPVISSKLIQVVNSPVYRTINPITSCHDAVTMLGLTTTRNLVTSISMKNLFKSHNKELNNKIHILWKQSIRVSSISYTLAVQSKKINPDEALLAGLIYNIGALPIIIFADSLDDDVYSSVDLNLCIRVLQGLIGNEILKKWGFPESLMQIPRETENWFHNGGENLELADVVILAKFHSLLGTKQVKNLPPINTLPAFQKLGDNSLTPELSLQTLDDAKQQISEAMSLFVA